MPPSEVLTLKTRIAELEQKNKELEALVESLKASAAAEEKGAEIVRLTDELHNAKMQLMKLSQNERRQSRMLFSLTRESGPRKGGADRIGAITMKRHAMRSEEVRVLKEEVTLWLNRVLEATLTPDLLLEELSDGIQLCRLVHKVSADVSKVGKFRENAKPGSFLAHENVQLFLKACAALGVLPYTLFESGALLSDRKNPRAVVLCLLSLARVAEKYGIEPPDIIKLEKEIELIKAGKYVLPDVGKDEIDAKVREVCAENNYPLPQKLKKGEYMFPNETLAYVRLVRGQPLVRHGDSWEELGPFIMQKLREEVKAQSGGVVSPPMSPSEAIEVPPSPVSVSEPPTPTAEEEEKARLEEQERRRREEIEAKKEFFCLSALSIKLNSPLREDIVVISNEELYEKAIEEEVPFYQYYEWIQKEMVKTLLENTRKERMRDFGGDPDDEPSGAELDLRGHRAQVMGALNRRQTIQKEKDAATAAREQKAAAAGSK